MIVIVIVDYDRGLWSWNMIAIMIVDYDRDFDRRLWLWLDYDRDYYRRFWSRLWSWIMIAILIVDYDRDYDRGQCNAPQREKTWHVLSTKTHISPCIRMVWSWSNYVSLVLQSGHVMILVRLHECSDRSEFSLGYVPVKVRYLTLRLIQLRESLFFMTGN